MREGGNVRSGLVASRWTVSARRVAAGLVLGLVLMLPAIASAAPPQLWAYHAYWMRDAWRLYDLGQFQRLLFFDVSVTPQAELQRNGWPEQWRDLRAQARAADVPVDPVVTILDKETFVAIFGQPSLRQKLLAEIRTMMRQEPRAGLHLDVELFDAVDPEPIAGFRQFVADLRAAIKRDGQRALTAFVPVGGALYGPQELAALDGVVAQGYDLHWANGPTAGPVSVLDWPGSAIAWRPAGEQLVAAGVPPARIFFSSPLYGYEWPTVSDAARAATRGPGHTVTYAPVPAFLLPDISVNALSQAAANGLRRDKATAAPWYAARRSDGWWQGWFDDPASLQPRLEFVRNGGFGGVAFFVLGYDGGALVDAARAAFRAGNAGVADIPPPPGH